MKFLLLLPSKEGTSDLRCISHEAGARDLSYSAVVRRSGSLKKVRLIPLQCISRLSCYRYVPYVIRRLIVGKFLRSPPL